MSQDPNSLAAANKMNQLLVKGVKKFYITTLMRKFGIEQEQAEPELSDEPKMEQDLESKSVKFQSS